MFFLFVNLFWVLTTLWSAWGMGAVLVVAAVLNHLITRYDMGLRRRAAGMDSQPDGPS